MKYLFEFLRYIGIVIKFPFKLIYLPLKVQSNIETFRKYGTWALQDYFCENGVFFL